MRWWIACALALMLAGCSGDDGTVSSTTTSGTATATTTTTSAPPPAPLVADLSANRTVALAPANITFTVSATGAIGTGLQWTLAFGDGSSTNGTTLPANVTHVYAAAANVTATLQVRDNRGRLANDTLEVAIRSFAPALPGTLVYEFGAAAGCVSDANAISGGVVPPNCVSFHAGPDAPAVDGHWLPLTPDYWGLQVAVVSDAETGDSDCFFIGDDHATIVGDAHNSGDECLGLVPAGTAYVFLYPWGAPATTMVATFSAAPTA